MSINEKINQYLAYHPKARDVIRYVVTGIIFVSVTLFMMWGISVKAEKNRAIIREQELAEERAQIWAEDQARMQALEAQRAADEAARKMAIEEDIILMSKFFAGIDGFVENWGYSDRDIRTYGECVINRVLDKRFPNTIEEVITQENQWVGFSENNQVIEKYYQIASTVVNNYYNDAIRPCSSAYCWVDLNKNGCWLMSEYSDSPYVGRWRYST